MDGFNLALPSKRPCRGQTQTMSVRCRCAMMQLCHACTAVATTPTWSQGRSWPAHTEVNGGGVDQKRDCLVSKMCCCVYRHHIHCSYTEKTVTVLHNAHCNAPSPSPPHRGQCTRVAACVCVCVRVCRWADAIPCRVWTPPNRAVSSAASSFRGHKT